MVLWMMWLGLPHLAFTKSGPFLACLAWIVKLYSKVPIWGVGIKFLELWGLRGRHLQDFILVGL